MLLSTSPFLTSLALTLLHFMWQGLLVAVILKSALLICSNHKSLIRYSLSTLAMFANFLLPLVTFIIIYQTDSAYTNSVVLKSLILKLTQPDSFFGVNEVLELLPSLLPYIAILWLASITFLAGKLLLDIYNVNNLPLNKTTPPNQKLQTRFNELVRQMQLTITPRLLISWKVEVPMAIGWLKPVVLLPACMISGLSAPQLEMLLLHELAHIRRHDYLVNLFQSLVEILLFFHPAVHWVSKQMRDEREYCSDDIAVQHCDDPIAYAHTLADTASLYKKTHVHTIPELAIALTGGDLKQRVTRLVGHHCAPKDNISKWFASATIIFSVLILSSKQLLTIPLVDTLHDEKVWQASMPTKQIEEGTSQQGTSLPTHSIALALLTTQVGDGNLDKTSPTDVKQQDITLSRLPLLALLTNSSLKEEQVNDLQNKQSNTESSQIKQVDERNNSERKSILLTNTSQQQPTTLTEIPVSNKEPAKSIKAIDKKSHANSTMVSANTAHKLINHIARQKEEQVKPISIEKKSINPITPVWHSAERVKSVTPIYPNIAKRKGIEIEVKVNFTIDIDGQVKDIKFAHHNRINYFKKSIRTAIKKWRYLPAKINEKPVESHMAKVFSFSLES